MLAGAVDFDWHQMIEECRHSKQVGGLRDASIYEAMLTLRRVERIVAANWSKKITQQRPDAFVLKRNEEVQKNTLNKDMRNLHAFLNWAVRNRFVAPRLEIKKVKVPQKPVTVLYVPQVRGLLTAASKYRTVRLSVLLAVTT